MLKTKAIKNGKLNQRYTQLTNPVHQKKERIANEKKVSEINVNYPKASTFQT